MLKSLIVSKFKFVAYLCMLTLCQIGCQTVTPDSYKGMEAKEIYASGKKHAEKERFSLAIKDFEALESHYPYGEYADKGQLALIHAYYKKGEAASALAAAERFIRINPKHPNIDYAHYLKGLINYDENFSAAYRVFPIDRSKRDPSLARSAFFDFKYLIEYFPNSPYSPDAKQRMIYLKHQLANHELVIAKQQIAKEHYLAAANRANALITQYSDTPAAQEALSLLIKAYRALDMPKMVAQAEKLQKTNTP